MATPPRRTWGRIAAIVAVIVVAHVVIVTWFVLGSSDRPNSTTRASGDPPVATRDLLPLAATTIDPPKATLPTITPTPVITPTDAGSPVTPEPIEELSAFFRKPPGADEWTPEQRRVYLQKLLDDLDDKERSLERELRAAERSGDKAKAEEKRATLAHLRSRKTDIVASVQSRLDASL